MQASTHLARFPSSWSEVAAAGRALLARARPLLVTSSALRQQHLVLLRRRSIFWFGLLLAMSVVVYLSARNQQQIQTQPLFFGRVPLPLDEISLAQWLLGLWLLVGSSLIFLRRVPLPAEGAKDNTARQRAHTVLLAVLLTASAFWWTLGLYGLRPTGSQTEFVLSARTFLWLTALGHVVTAVLLASSWPALLSVLMLGCLIPCRFYLYYSGTEPNFVGLLWLTGELCAFFGVGLLFHIDQRRLLSRQLKLEAERTRADNLSYQKARLLESFSHDMMQALTALGFQLGSLRRRVQDPATVELVEAASVQHQSLQTMLESARDLADAEAGQFPCNPREVALQPLLRKVAGTTCLSAEQHGVRLNVFAPALMVFTDPDLLERIVLNFVSNAIKYSKHCDNAHVLIGCRVRARTVRIGVYDNGVGIPDERQGDIFEEYVQLDNPERDRRKGLGLGLAIVRAFAKLLGHKVSVSSRVGHGSIFSVEVPLVGRVPLELQGRSGVSGTLVSLKGMRVCLVEDEPWQLQAMSTQLREWGCEVTAATSGAALVASLVNGEAARPDVLITDHRLRQNETGFDVIQAVRAIHHAVPAVIWTANLPSKVLEQMDHADVRVISKGKFDELAAALVKRHKHRARTAETPLGG